MSDDGLTRRSVLVRGAAVAAATSLPAAALPAIAKGQISAADRGWGRTLGLERILASALDYLVTEQLPDRGTTRTLERLAGQVDERIRLIRPLNGRAGAIPEPAPSEIPGLVETTGRNALLNLVLGFESQVYAAYLDVVGDIGDPADLALAGGLAAGVGQHLAILRIELGEDPVPRALESGAVT